MQTPRFVLSFVFSLIFVLARSSLAAGPESTLYVMNYGEFSGGTVTGLDLFQGVSETSFPTGNLVDMCIAVSGDVRTMGYATTYSGSRFNLAGGPLAGGPYTNNIVNSQLHDGTTDGNYNYSVNYSTGDVLRFDRNWASPTVLFNPASGLFPGPGYITMNTADGSFWISEWGGPDRVEHRSSIGTLLGSFNFGIMGTAGLALDPADGTLWMSNGNNTLYQFSQGGILLQSPTYGISGQLLGMEFNAPETPEPASLAVWGIGITLLLRRRRK